MGDTLGYSSGPVHRYRFESDGMMHKAKLALVLACVWVLLSGILSPLLLGFGLASSLAVAWLAARADRRDGEPVPFALRLVRLARYLLWLAWEIVKANVDVSRRILSPSLPIAPAVRWLPASQHSELGRVIYADSITLTPGTLSIDLTDEWVEVHALNEESLDALARGLDMDDRVSRLEPASARSGSSVSERAGPAASESARSGPPASGPPRSGPPVSERAGPSASEAARPEPPASEPSP